MRRSTKESQGRSSNRGSNRQSTAQTFTCVYKLGLFRLTARLSGRSLKSSERHLLSLVPALSQPCMAATFNHRGSESPHARPVWPTS